MTEQQYDTERLNELAKRHLWMHFTRHSTYYDGGQVPVIVKGEGHKIWDDQGKQYIVYAEGAGNTTKLTALRLP